jgi:hypothetical protein
MGRELFDFAFKEYSQRWMFKHPTPDDFFRTMEDASAVDLDWFWRGWFYSTDFVDLSIDDVKWFKIDSKDPNVEKPLKQKLAENKREYISDIRNKEDIKEPMVIKDPSLLDFYNKYDPFDVTVLDEEEFEKYYNSLSEDEKKILKSNNNYYEIKFSNIGGLIMPIILEFEYADGTKEVKRIPPEIWRMRHDKVSKVFVTEKEVKNITLDPFLETADVNTNNNYWPPKTEPTRFQLFKQKMQMPKNPMQRQKEMDEK